jgi:hypothetical protein
MVHGDGVWCLVYGEWCLVLGSKCVLAHCARCVNEQRTYPRRSAAGSLESPCILTSATSTGQQKNEATLPACQHQPQTSRNEHVTVSIIAADKSTPVGGWQGVATHAMTACTESISKSMMPCTGSVWKSIVSALTASRRPRHSLSRGIAI